MESGEGTVACQTAIESDVVLERCVVHVVLVVVKFHGEKCLAANCIEKRRIITAIDALWFC